MSMEMARDIFNCAIGLKDMGRKQLHLVALGGNNLRNCKEEPQSVLDMFEFLMIKTRNIPGKLINLKLQKDCLH